MLIYSTYFYSTLSTIWNPIPHTQLSGQHYLLYPSQNIKKYYTRFMLGSGMKLVGRIRLFSSERYCILPGTVRYIHLVTPRFRFLKHSLELPPLSISFVGQCNTSWLLKKAKFCRLPLLEITISSLSSARYAPFWGNISGVTGQF